MPDVPTADRGPSSAQSQRRLEAESRLRRRRIVAGGAALAVVVAIGIGVPRLLSSDAVVTDASAAIPHLPIAAAPGLATSPTAQTPATTKTRSKKQGVASQPDQRDGFAGSTAGQVADVPAPVAEQLAQAKAVRDEAQQLPMLSEGDSGDVITIAQAALGIEQTGYFGPQTRAAVEDYQRSLGLPATGVIATYTWSSLGIDAVTEAQTAAADPQGYVQGDPDVDTTAVANDSTATEASSSAPSAENSARPQARAATSTKPPVLEETDSGEAVAVLQRALGVKPASGYFGPVTTNAVQSFQKSVGLPTTGVVATYTWHSLGTDLATQVAAAHATYGTDFGPGIPDAPSKTSGGGHNGGGGSSGGGGNSGSGSQSVSGRFCPTDSFSYGDGMGADRGDHSHQGVDLMGSRGEPIYAIDAGTVTREEWQSNGALVLDITGDNGMFFYGHFDSITVSYGEYVKAGQIIGYMGDTGSPGAVHLHLEDRPYGWNGNAVDPVPLVHKLCD